jgi:hypothetical protein
LTLSVIKVLYFQGKNRFARFVIGIGIGIGEDKALGKVAWGMLMEGVAAN